jgi:hypothetical protein
MDVVHLGDGIYASGESDFGTGFDQNKGSVVDVQVEGGKVGRSKKEDLSPLDQLQREQNGHQKSQAISVTNNRKGK